MYIYRPIYIIYIIYIYIYIYIYKQYKQAEGHEEGVYIYYMYTPSSWPSACLYSTIFKGPLVTFVNRLIK